MSTIFSFTLHFISLPLTHIRNSNLCLLPLHIYLFHLFDHSFTASFNKYLLSICICQAGGKVLEKVKTVSTLGEIVGSADTHMPAIRIQYSNQYKEYELIQRVVEAEMKHLGLLKDVRKASERSWLLTWHLSSWPD